VYIYTYGLATISRLLKIIGLFYRISSVLWGSFAKETYNLKEPTNRSHPICINVYIQSSALLVNNDLEETLILNLHFFVDIILFTLSDHTKKRFLSF